MWLEWESTDKETLFPLCVVLHQGILINVKHQGQSKWLVAFSPEVGQWPWLFVSPLPAKVLLPQQMTSVGIRTNTDSTPSRTHPPGPIVESKLMSYFFMASVQNTNMHLSRIERLDFFFMSSSIDHFYSIHENVVCEDVFTADRWSTS